MLTELYHIAKNLSKSEQEQSLVHVDFGEPGLSTNQNLLLVIGDNGEILKLEALVSEETDCLWTLKKGNFKFFPAVRMSHPLISIPINAPEWNILKKLSAENLKTILAERGQNLLQIDLNAESEQAKRILFWHHDDHETLEKLQSFAARFLAMVKNPSKFSKTLATALNAALVLQKDGKLLKAYQTLLCGAWAEKKNKPPKLECKAQIIFDYLPKGELTGILYSPRMKRVVLECLNENEEKAAEEKSKKQVTQEAPIECALTGTPVSLLSGPFADWSAKPIIGKPFKPFSKFSDAPCNFRYGKADSDGFSVGSNTAKALVAAGCSVTTSEWRGKTWDSIRNGKFEERNGKKSEMSDVLIAYPTFPWGELKPVSVFTEQRSPEVSEQEEDEDNEVNYMPVSFTQSAESFCKGLKKKVSTDDLKARFIRLLILRQISPGQVQLAYSETPSCHRFVESLECWIASEKSLPAFLKIPLPSKRTKSGYVWVRPKLLYPDEAIRVFSHQWVRDGTESTRIQSPAIGDIFDVFLRKEGVCKPTSRRLLEILLPRVEPLLIGSGNILNQTEVSDLRKWRDFVSKTSAGKPDLGKPDPKYYLAQSLSLIGTLLYVMNTELQSPSPSNSFRLGQFLSLVDRIHYAYGLIVRESLPSVLLGNGLVRIAKDSPARAYEEVLDRLMPHLNWIQTSSPLPAPTKEQLDSPDGKIAKQARAAQGKRNAWYKADRAFKAFNEISPILAHSISDKPLKTEQTAQLLLGYLTDPAPYQPENK